MERATQYCTVTVHRAAGHNTHQTGKHADVVVVEGVCCVALIVLQPEATVVFEKASGFNRAKPVGCHPAAPATHVRPPVTATRCCGAFNAARAVAKQMLGDCQSRAEAAKGLPTMCEPTAEEGTRHGLRHLPYRRWCKRCTMAGITKPAANCPTAILTYTTTHSR